MSLNTTAGFNGNQLERYKAKPATPMVARGGFNPTPKPVGKNGGFNPTSITRHPKTVGKKVGLKPTSIGVGFNPTLNSGKERGI